MKVINPLYGLSIETHYDVAFLKPSFSRRTLLLKRYDQNATFDRQIIKPDDAARQRHVLSGKPYVAAAYRAIAYQATCDKRRSVNRSCEAYALRRKNHGRVHAYDFRARIY